jgi:UDP-N-acetylglucosamine 2-epimerase (non-hydrolysing)
MKKLLCVCGARPNFMKIAPILKSLSRVPSAQPALIHTGQHYDDRMSTRFFRDLGIPAPDVNLEVGSGSHAAQTAEVMKRFEPICLERKPDGVVVVGDVNSTLACALVAAKLGIHVAHVEAGLRSFDRSMPEEINRVLTDAISDSLFVSEPSGVENLRREGVAAEKIHFVGNVMVDTLLQNRARADKSLILATHGLRPKSYAVATLHRPSNVDDPAALAPILDALARISEELPVVFPVHPRTRKNLEAAQVGSGLAGLGRLRFIEPLGYLDFLKLMADAAIMLTDSGGIQEETTILGVPCLTLRDNTERPVTVTQGTNRLTGNRPEAILRSFEEVRRNPRRASVPELWDGKAADRIVACLTGQEPAPARRKDEPVLSAG